MRYKFYVTLLLLGLLVGCGHSQSYKVGLMSFGNLEGKTIPENCEGQVVQGKDCGRTHYLSNAVRNALKGTECDTLVDAEVTNTTALSIFSNCISVKGKAINSAKIQNSGVIQ